MITLCAAVVAIICGVKWWQWKKRYQYNMALHQKRCKTWVMVFMVLLDQRIQSHFENSPVITNHIVRLTKKSKVEILIGDSECLVPVNMRLINNNPGRALDEACRRFTKLKA